MKQTLLAQVWLIANLETLEGPKQHWKGLIIFWIEENMYGSNLLSSLCIHLMHFISITVEY